MEEIADNSDELSISKVLREAEQGLIAHFCGALQVAGRQEKPHPLLGGEVLDVYQIEVYGKTPRAHFCRANRRHEHQSEDKYHPSHSHPE